MSAAIAQYKSKQRREGFLPPTLPGTYERSTFVCSPPELHEWLLTPGSFAKKDVQDQLMTYKRHTALAVQGMGFHVDTLRDSVAFAMSLCTKSLLAVSVAQCPVWNPQAWQLLLQGVATCPHVTVLDLPKTHFTREAAQELVSSVLPRCRALQELNLSENPSLRDEGVLLVLRGITRSATPLQKLGLRDVGIRDLEISTHELLLMPMLCQVDLSGNPFPASEGTAHLVASLENHLRANFERIHSYEAIADADESGACVSVQDSVLSLGTRCSSRECSVPSTPLNVIRTVSMGPSTPDTPLSKSMCTTPVNRNVTPCFTSRFVVRGAACVLPDASIVSRTSSVSSPESSSTSPNINHFASSGGGPSGVRTDAMGSRQRSSMLRSVFKNEL